MGRGVKEEKWECEREIKVERRKGGRGWKIDNMIVKVQGRGLDRDECKA